MRRNPFYAIVPSLYPHWVITGVILVALLIWAVSLLSITSQVGRPFPGFLYTPGYIVSSFTPADFTGWQAGLRPRDRILAVSGHPWWKMQQLVQEMEIGTPVIYTVERGNQELQVTVPTMEFTPDIIWRFIPGYLFSASLFLTIGIFIYIRNPAGRLNCYLLLYLLLWVSVVGVVWEVYLSQHKWMAYLLYPFAVAAPVAGWVFFWSFPADRARKEFLVRWPLIPAFIILALLFTSYLQILLYLTPRLDNPALWRVFLWFNSWGYFSIFGIGSIFFKLFPLLQLTLRKSTHPLIRQQAQVLLIGLAIGLGGWFIFIWAPASIHWIPPAGAQWAGIIVTLYPLAVGYAVLRYRLFNIRVVVRRGLIYSLATAVLTTLYLILSLLTGYLFQALTGRESFLAALIPALSIAVLFQPVRNRIQALVDRAFFRREYHTRQTLTTFSRDLSALNEQDEVVRLVLDTVGKALEAEKTAIWLLDGDRYRPWGEPSGLSQLQELSAWLLQERHPLLLLPGNHSPQARELRQIGAILAVPLLTCTRTEENALLGILTLGQKRSGEPYSQEDVELLSTLAHSAALALENARLHEERLRLLRHQLAQITAAQEEERQRIARELHDGIGPTLVSINIRLHTARRLLERDHHPVAQEIGELTELTQANIQDIRRLIYDLRPVALDKLGLVPALREYIARFRREHSLSIEFIADANDELPAPVETALFRITQEALNNVIRHARAHKVEILLRRRANYVSLEIKDDGKGFDPKARSATTHLGLWSMRERTAQLKGHFEVISQPGTGTTIKAVIPLEGRIEGNCG